MKPEHDYLPAQIVRRVPPRPSAQKSGNWNNTEMMVGHAVAIHAIREGVTRTTDVAAALAAYRERIVARIKCGGDVEDLIADIRAGVLK
jgi:hypothetical protein